MPRRSASRRSAAHNVPASVSGFRAMHLAPAEARAQILAQRQIDRRHAAGGG